MKKADVVGSIAAADGGDLKAAQVGNDNCGRLHDRHRYWQQSCRSLRSLTKTG